MRALAHVNRRTAPDYALHVPGALQVLIAFGLLGGVTGIGLLIGAPALLPIYGLVLVVVGVLSGAATAALLTITSSRLRESARRRMLQAVAWHGDERVLDVGCGNGFLLTEVAKHLTGGTATGIDVWKTNAGDQSPELARRNAYREGVADRVEIKHADARVMPFEDNTFDVIVSSLMLHHAGGSIERHQVLQEMVRVLKPGGTILLYDVWPLIGGAARQLRALGLGSIDRSGRIMAVLSAKRPGASSAL
jgi:SAM-dependent methyltransferase